MNGLTKFLNYEFSTGGVAGPDYIEFQKRFLGYIKKEAKAVGLEMASHTKGHYECSCFIKNPENNKYAYISISDVRFFTNEWYEKVLYRTAEGPKDYRGGHNNFCKLKELIGNIQRIVA